MDRRRSNALLLAVDTRSRRTVDERNRGGEVFGGREQVVAETRTRRGPASSRERLPRPLGAGLARPEAPWTAGGGASRPSLRERSTAPRSSRALRGTGVRPAPRNPGESGDSKRAGGARLAGGERSRDRSEREAGSAAAGDAVDLQSAEARRVEGDAACWNDGRRSERSADIARPPPADVPGTGRVGVGPRR